MLNELRQGNFNKTQSFLTKPRNIIIALVAIIAIVIIGFVVFGRNSSGSDNKPSVEINRKYSVIARTQSKQRTDGRFTMNVTDAQFADSILVQGKRATPVESKTFLILNMEIENPYKVPLYAFPVDLFRFVRDDGQKFAPSVHQGAVLIQPQSTKKSNVAFVVLPSEKHFKIEVGEIGEQKETLEITF